MRLFVRKMITSVKQSVEKKSLAAAAAKLKCLSLERVKIEF